MVHEHSIDRRGKFSLLLALLFLPVSSLCAQETPTLVVSIRSINDTLSIARYVDEAMPQAGEEKLSDILAGTIGLRGERLKGIDLTKPLGAYAIAGANLLDSAFAVMVPVTGEAAFVEMLRGFGQEPEKDDTGLYSLNLPSGQTLFFRVTNDYCYITMASKLSLTPNRMASPSILVSSNQPLFNAALAISRVPAQWMGFLTSSIDREMAKPSTKTGSEAMFEELGKKHFVGLVKQVLREGDKLAIFVDVDQQSGLLEYGSRLTARKRTPLAASIADLAQPHSRLVHLVNRGEPAIRILLRAQNMQSFLDGFVSAIEEGMKDQPPEASATWSALKPHLDTQTLEFAASMSPDALLVGLTVKDGAGLERKIKPIAEPGLTHFKPGENQGF